MRHQIALNLDSFRAAPEISCERSPDALLPWGDPYILKLAAQLEREAREQIESAFREVLRYGSAACAFRALAMGDRHFSIYNNLWAWDHAAGVLIHSEAGGYTARVDGAPYRPVDRVPGLLSAPDEETWQRIDAFLKPA